MALCGEYYVRKRGNASSIRHLAVSNPETPFIRSNDRAVVVVEKIV